MLFHSLQYLAFLAGSYALFWLVAPHRNLRLAVLALTSLIFYAAWTPFPLLVFALSAALVRLSVWVMTRTQSAKARETWMIVSVAGNLAVLALFKYADLFYATTAQLFAHLPAHLTARLGVNLVYQPLGFVLPLGLSFITFQAISYVVDVYRGDVPGEHSYFKIMLHLLFFPHVVSGPIVRAKDLLMQLDERPTLSTQDGAQALFRIATGIAKKLLIADVLSSGLVDRVFSAPGHYTSAECAVAALAYTFQLYYDFSGYSDIAVGSARLFGFKFPENFGRPYLAANLFDFWNQWHLSLSTWLRDYLYRPLGGSHTTKFKTLRNLMITMSLGGLWHGADWRFLVWGGIHGVCLCIVRVYWWIRPRRDRRRRVNVFGYAVGLVATLSIVVFSRVFFRASDMTHAFDMFAQLAELTPGTANVSRLVWVTLLASMALHATPRDWYERALQSFVWLPAPARAVGLVALGLLIRQVASVEVQPYIYFQF